MSAVKKLIPYVGKDRREHPLRIEGIHLEHEVASLFAGGANTAQIARILMLPEAQCANALARARDRERGQ